MARRGARIEGFRECSATLSTLSKGMARGVGKRSLAVPADILAFAVIMHAPILSGSLRASVNVQPDKTRKGRPQIQVRADDIASVQNEFGNSNMAAQPFFRPAVEEAKPRMFEAFASALKSETDATVARVAKRAARKAKG